MLEKRETKWGWVDKLVARPLATAELYSSNSDIPEIS
jgi:hypothetical protein